jgi:hypothetical protein
MTIELIEVPLANRKLVERFIRVQWWIHRVHAPSDVWVPPLLIDRRDYLNPNKSLTSKGNPFFEHAECAFWIAVQDGQDVGRIAAVVDHDWEPFHGTKTGNFGFFDSPDDPEVAEVLLTCAENWLKERGRTDIIGPLDLSTNYLSGARVEGFDIAPGMQMPYNPPYYGALIEGRGYTKAKDLWTWEFLVANGLPERVERIADKIKKRAKVTIRQMNLKDWDNEVDKVVEIYNSAWEKNWGFVPVSDKEFRHIAIDLKMVIQEETALMAEVDGEPVAFCITVKDIQPALKKVDGKLAPFGWLSLLWDLKLRPQIDWARLVVMGIKEGYRRRGIDSVLFVETFRGAQKAGWRGAEIGWTLEDNHMVNRAIETMGGTKTKTYRVFGKDL